MVELSKSEGTDDVGFSDKAEAEVTRRDNDSQETKQPDDIQENKK